MYKLEDLIEITSNVWARELNVDIDEVKPDSDFFELGGSSLKLLGLMDKLVQDDEFPYIENLKVTALFDNPTPRLFSELIYKKYNASEQ